MHARIVVSVHRRWSKHLSAAGSAWGTGRKQCVRRWEWGCGRLESFWECRHPELPPQGQRPRRALNPNSGRVPGLGPRPASGFDTWQGWGGGQPSAATWWRAPEGTFLSYCHLGGDTHPYSSAFTKASFASMRIWTSALAASSVAPDSSACAFSRLALAVYRGAETEGERLSPTKQEPTETLEGRKGKCLHSSLPRSRMGWDACCLPQFPQGHSPPGPACPASQPLRQAAAQRSQH